MKHTITAIIVFGLIGDFWSNTEVLSQEHACPKPCDCLATFTDCSRKEIFELPKQIPTFTEKLYLNSNFMAILNERGIEHLQRLRILRLNNNQISKLPEVFLSSANQLLRLDLSHNKITEISKNTFATNTLLRSIQLDHNELTCIHDNAFRGLQELEILTLNNNNLTFIFGDVFKPLTKLKTLRIYDNPLVCNCNLLWIYSFSHRLPRITLQTKCFNSHLKKYISLSNIKPGELKCTGAIEKRSNICKKQHNVCFSLCSCADGIVDCRMKSLAELPSEFGLDSVEMRLEQNYLTNLGPNAFSKYKLLRRIDLSNNNLTNIAADSFSGLKQLSTLVLYGNRIKSLPSTVFMGLDSLQLLLLNANQISCLHQNLFKDLFNLHLLSLYDNNIKFIPEGAFESLTNIKTLHLAKNPFNCDCNLRWLANFLGKNPIETSGARCLTPKRLYRKRLENLLDEQLYCKENAVSKTTCDEVTVCPDSCICDDNKLNCSRSRKKVIPSDVPLATAEIIFDYNNLTAIEPQGVFGYLPYLVKASFKKNQIKSIANNAFEGNDKLTSLDLSQNLLTSVNGKTFYGLKNLKILNLSQNQISCLGPNSFDHFHQILQIDINHNAIMCDCHMSWLIKWIEKNQMANLKLKCQEPNSLRNVLIKNLNTSSLECQEPASKCYDDDFCPAKCSCSGTIVRCSKQGLTHIPSNIAQVSTELYLDFNAVQQLNPENFASLVDLQRLDMSNNKLDFLPDFLFANLHDLSTLVLNFNLIRCVTKNAFAGLTSLKVLSLHGNSISVLPSGLLQDLKSLTHLAIGANPLYCDCHMKWLSEVIKKDYIEPGIARCQHPKEMNDRLILSTPNSHFVCNSSVPNDVLSKCNVCLNNPCSNNATCEMDTNGGYSCNCLPGNHGKHCEFLIDACYGQPCENGGTCNVLDEGRFECKCPIGYTGSRCEENYNDCLHHNCQNNSTCIDMANTYACACLPQYTGVYCENKISFCLEDPDVCKNNGTCIENSTDYECLCPPNFRGKDCSEEIDECFNNLCSVGSTCVNGVCICPKGHYGKFCEKTPDVSLHYHQTSPCENHECKHGVCFLPDPKSSEYTCKCDDGYTGKYCEYLTSIELKHNSGFVEIEPLRSNTAINITMVFKTNSRNGVLIYNGLEGHIAAELFNGRIRVSYDVGNQPISSMYSFEIVSDGSYHTAEFLAINKNFTMRVDGGLARSIFNEGIKNTLHLTTSFFVGGLPEDMSDVVQRKWHLRNTTSFIGCIDGLWLNNKRVDFENALSKNKLYPGCEKKLLTQKSSLYSQLQNTEHKNTGCHKNVCKNGGTCSIEDDETKCHCKPGHSGEFCEKAGSNCKKQQIREFYLEGDCKSKQIVKYARCHGTCESSCCQPKVVKRRKVRMTCSNNKKLVKNLKIIRKCHCKSCY